MDYRKCVWADNISSMLRRTELNLMRLHTPSTDFHYSPSSTTREPFNTPKNELTLKSFEEKTRENNSDQQKEFEDFIKEFEKDVQLKFRDQQKNINGLIERFEVLEGFNGEFIDLNEKLQKRISGVEKKFNEELERVEKFSEGAISVQEMRRMLEEFKKTDFEVVERLRVEVKSVRDEQFEKKVQALKEIEEQIKESLKKFVIKEEFYETKSELEGKFEENLRNSEVNFEGKIERLKKKHKKTCDRIQNDLTDCESSLNVAIGALNGKLETIQSALGEAKTNDQQENMRFRTEIERLEEILERSDLQQRVTKIERNVKTIKLPEVDLSGFVEKEEVKQWEKKFEMVLKEKRGLEKRVVELENRILRIESIEIVKKPKPVLTISKGLSIDGSDSLGKTGFFGSESKRINIPMATETFSFDVLNSLGNTGVFEDGQIKDMLVTENFSFDVLNTIQTNLIRKSFKMEIESFSFEILNVLGDESERVRVPMVVETFSFEVLNSSGKISGFGRVQGCMAMESFSFSVLNWNRSELIRKKLKNQTFSFNILNWNRNELIRKKMKTETFSLGIMKEKIEVSAMYRVLEIETVSFDVFNAIGEHYQLESELRKKRTQMSTETVVFEIINASDKIGVFGTVQIKPLVIETTSFDILNAFGENSLIEIEPIREKITMNTETLSISVFSTPLKKGNENLLIRTPMEIETLSFELLNSQKSARMRTQLVTETYSFGILTALGKIEPVKNMPIRANKALVAQTFSFEIFPTLGKATIAEIDSLRASLATQTFSFEICNTLGDMSKSVSIRAPLATESFYLEIRGKRVEDKPEEFDIILTAKCLNQDFSEQPFENEEKVIVQENIEEGEIVFEENLVKEINFKENLENEIGFKENLKEDMIFQEGLEEDIVFKEGLNQAEIDFQEDLEGEDEDEDLGVEDEEADDEEYQYDDEENKGESEDEEYKYDEEENKEESEDEEIILYENIGKKEKVLNKNIKVDQEKNQEYSAFPIVTKKLFASIESSSESETLKQEPFEKPTFNPNKFNLNIPTLQNPIPAQKLIKKSKIEEAQLSKKNAEIQFTQDLYNEFIDDELKFCCDLATPNLYPLNSRRKISRVKYEGNIFKRVEMQWEDYDSDSSSEDQEIESSSVDEGLFVLQS